MDQPLIIKLESARGEIMNCLQNVQTKYSFPASILDGVLSQVLAEIRGEEKIELINANNQMIKNIENKNSAITANEPNEIKK